MKLFLLFIALSITSVSISQKDTTSIALTLSKEITGYSNVIYCSSVELLWKELTNYLGEQPIPKEKHSKIEELNRITSNYQSPIEEEFWFAKVGLKENGIVDTIKNAYKNQFDIDWSPSGDNNADLLGLSYLQKNINFYSRLDHDFHDFKFKDSIHVKCFGLDHGWGNPKYKVQLKIHDYKNEDDFIFQMGCKDSIDEIYFAKIPPKSNLKETYEEVIRRVNKNNLEYIVDFDELQLPYLKFDINNQFKEFQKVELANKKHQQLLFEELSQRIQFDLNKDGIKLESSAATSIILGISDVVPRIYAFDQPFLIILKRKGQLNPYFLYWVGNSEHMEVID
jgi:hypothetical protein